MKKLAITFASITCACYGALGPADEQPAEARQLTATSCAPTNPGDCLYRPAAKYSAITLAPMALDVAHRDEDLIVTVAYPDTAMDPLPVVVWTHGGGSTPGENQKGAAWAEALAEAGYLVLKLSHVDRDPSDFADLCMNGALPPVPNGGSISNCSLVEIGRYDKPMDVRAVLDALAQIETQVALDFDLDRVAVAGHSGGSAATLSVAGALREVGLDTLDFAHPLPKAFVALSPQGPGEDGWTTTSYGDVRRPVFTATGAGDNRGTTLWTHRVQPFDLMPAGEGKARFFIDSRQAKHGTFNLGDAGSSSYHPWLKSAVVAFLDATLREDAAAAAYLTSGDLVGELVQDPYIPSGESGVPEAWCWKRHTNGDCITP